MYSQDSWQREEQRNWIPCLLRDDDRYALWARDGGDDVQTTGNKIYLHYRIPTSGFLNRRRLFVDGIRIGLRQADSNNFISKAVLLGVNHTGCDHVWEHNANMNSEGDHVFPVNPPQDMSRFAAADLRVTLKVTKPSVLRVAYISVSINYR